ncbi:carbohydrate kinase family protein [Patescibacteria group bacterium]
MFDIITFGSATRDSFLKLKKGNYEIIKARRFLTNKGLCFSLGSKIEVEDLVVSTGGGGTNSAVNFANQGFKTAYVGKVGKDKRGEAVIEDLEDFGVFTQFLKKDKKRATAYSVILSFPFGKRTILVFRGACHFITLKEIPFSKLKAQWFYIAPLSGASAKIFKPLVEFAKKNKIKIAANLGNSQISLGMKFLKPLLAKIDILNLNQEEASLLTKIPFQKEKEIFKKLDEIVKGIVIMTKGEKGCVVSDGNYLWRASAFSVPVVDTTGAGDAFGSGFISQFIKTKDIEKSIQFASQNAASCIQKIGAKKGLLKGGKTLSKVRIKKIKL